MPPSVLIVGGGIIGCAAAYELASSWAFFSGLRAPERSPDADP